MENGTVIGEKYKILRVLGEGGQGVVYAVEDILDGKKLKAMKMINTKQATNDVLRFKKEIGVLKLLSSEKIVKILDTNFNGNQKPEDYLWYVMEYAKYGSLSNHDYFRGDINLSLILFRKICEGVATLHDNKIVHRDLNPNNVLLVSNERDVKISDLGLAKDENDEDKLTGKREKVGTDYYCAPEQTSRPDQTSIKSDVFSLGRILIFMLTGEKLMPDQAISIKDIIKHQKIDEIQKLVNGMTEYNPNDRIDIISKIIFQIDLILEKPAEPVGFTPTKIQKRLLKYITSFIGNSVGIADIFDYASNFVTFKSVHAFFDMGVSEAQTRSQFTELIEDALLDLENNKLIEFYNGKYRTKN